MLNLAEHRPKKRMRRLLPYALALLGLWLLAGCFYLPLPEHPVHDPSETKPKKPLPVDFRHMVGDTKSKSPIRPGITRTQVLSALGEPNYLSSQNTLIYTMLAQRAAWVFPLCFNATPAQLRGYALRLTFDGDTLVRWELAHVDEDHDFIYRGYRSEAPWKAVRSFGEKGATSAALPTTQP